MKYGFLIVSALAGCAADAERQSVSPSLRVSVKTACEVMADPNLYAGQKIVVKGIYFAEPHQRLLYDNACRQLAFRVEHSITVKGNRKAIATIEKFRKLHPTVNIPVIYSGTFVAHRLIADCAEPSCYSYSLKDARLLAASPR